MPLRIELYALPAEDLERMEKSYRPMGFASRSYDNPVVPAKARAWLESCEPLLQRLGSQMSEELRTRVEKLRGREPGYELARGDRDKTRQFEFNLNVYSLFERLASEYLKKGMQPYAKHEFVLYEEVVWECFERMHFDRAPLVPGVHSVFSRPWGRSFASAPIDHSQSGRYFIWRSPKHLHAFFHAPSRKSFFEWPFFTRDQAPRDPLTPPTPEVVIARKNKRLHWVSTKDPIGSTRQAILWTQGHWNALVEVLRTAERSNGAFLSVCEDITPYD